MSRIVKKNIHILSKTEYFKEICGYSFFRNELFCKHLLHKSYTKSACNFPPCLEWTHCLSMLAISWLSSLTCFSSFSRSSAGDPRLLASSISPSRFISSSCSWSYSRTGGGRERNLVILFFNIGGLAAMITTNWFEGKQTIDFQ